MKISGIFLILFLNSQATFGKGLNKGESEWISSADFGVGVATFDQNIKSSHSEDGGGYRVALGNHYGPSDRSQPRLHLGLTYFDVGAEGVKGEGSSEIKSFEGLQLVAFRIGVTPWRWLKLDAGYGFAKFTRAVETFSGTPTLTTYDSTGRGWLLGVAVMPIKAGLMRFGWAGYYYSASAEAYSSKILNGQNETKEEITDHVRSSGYYSGFQVFFGY